MVNAKDLKSFGRTTLRVQVPPSAPFLRKALSIFAVFTLLAACSQEAEEDLWYEGGTLQNASVAEWREADLENKMASSLEWIVPLPGDYIGSLDEEPLAEMKSLSERFVGCLDREAGKEGVADATPMRDLASICVILANQVID